MKKSLAWVGLPASLASAAGALTVLRGRRRFRALVRREVLRLFSDTGPEPGPSQLAARWDFLPEPARRYLRFALPEGTPALRTARLKHDGFFRMKPNGRWLPIEGMEYFTVARPGFVWNALVRPAPLVWIEARDRLLSGRANMLVKLNSTLTIADAGGAEIDQGASLRWLAEAAWFPYGFVGDQVQWEPIDARSARVTLLQAGLPASAVVEVDEEGKLVRLHADRYRDVGGRGAELTPWTGHYRDYRDFNGIRVPSSVEVMWDLKEGEFSYARFRVTALEHNVAARF